MKGLHWGIALVSGVALVLVWMIVNVGIENDGLRQVIDGHRRSLQALLRVTQASSRCDVSPQEIATALSTSDHVVNARPQDTEIGDLAFTAKFRAGRLYEVSIVDVGKVDICATP